MATSLARTTKTALQVRTPSLPAWAVSRLESLTDNWQPPAGDPTGLSRKVPTLPGNLILLEYQRDQLHMAMSEFSILLDDYATLPIDNPDAAAEMLIILTRMLLAKPARRGSEQAGEAVGEAYMVALDDLPPWSVAAAVRRWHRGECGRERDYRWSPDSATLRDLAKQEVAKVEGQIIAIRRLLAAEPRAAELSKEHRTKMLDRLSKLMHGLFDPKQAPAAD